MRSVRSRALRAFAVVVLSIAGAAASQPSALTWGAYETFFIENRGVHGDDVAFYVEHDDGTILFGKQGVVLRDLDDRDLHMRFVGARDDARITGRDQRQTVVSYFSGPESNWKRGVPTFGAVAYEGLWPGIDLVFRGERGGLKYEFHVAPGADPAQIRLRYDGADAITIEDDGALSVRAHGRILRDPAPIAWQVVDSERLPVAARFAVESEPDRLISFDVGAYAPSHELVIDPAMLAYCGYAGPSRSILMDVAVDSVGAVYLLGMDFDPMIAGHDGIRIMKVAPDGSQITYVAFVNGSKYDAAVGLAVGPGGDVYVVGNTLSDETSFPVKVGPSLTLKTGIFPNDGYVLRLAPSGTNIVYCGYLGGNHQDAAYAVAVDANGVAYVTGNTVSVDMPAIGGPFLTKAVPWGYEAFIAKVKPDGSGLLLSGYLGGDGDDYGRAVAVDSRGDIYLCGITTSTTFPVKGGLGQALTIGTGSDAWVAKVDGQSGTLQYSGYLGGSGNDQAEGIAVDAAGAAYVVGPTTSDLQSFPTKIGPYLSYGPAFLAKVDVLGRGLVYCGRLSDAGGLDVAVGRGGEVYVVGISVGPTSAAVGGPSTVFGGATDAFICKVPPSGVAFAWGGYIGGSQGDFATDVAVDDSGNIYVCGATLSTEQTFPVKVGPGLTFNGGPQPYYPYGAFVAKITQTDLIATGTPRPGATVTLGLTASDDVGLAYQAGTSLGTGPIKIGGQSLGLSPDALLGLSTSGALPAVFQSYTGTIGANGQAAAAIALPSWPFLVGQTFHTAFLTLSASAPGGVKSVSNTVTTTIVP